MMKDIETAISKLSKELFGVSIQTDLTRPDEQFGDYSSNISLKVGSKLNTKPRLIAEELATRLKADLKNTVSDVSVAGPGFINIKLSDRALWRLAEAKPAQTYKGKVVVAEYSDPNPFKVLHAGHLYTSIVGDAIAKLLEEAGARVHRVNFGGDVGLHVGKTMWAILDDLGGENPEKLSMIPEDQRADWMSEAYVRGTKAYEDNETAEAEIIKLNKRVYQLHEAGDRDSPFAQIYWTTRQWSYDSFDKLYRELGMIPFDKYYPESETTPLGIKTVKDGLAKNIFEESEGAVVYRGEKDGFHTRVFLTSSGLPTYEAKDLGLAQQKWNDFQFDLSIMVTGNDIVEYMKVVSAALKHFQPEVVERTRHLTHGMIKLAGGVKMSSRKGDILRASDILDTAAEANLKLNKKDNPDAVLGAVRYSFLKQRTGGDIIYDPQESVSILGNSGPYLQYAHARARSILSRAQTSNFKLQTSNFEAEERSLVRKLGEYAEVVEQATEELMPHHVCTYLYELAQNFNSFYEKNRVIGDPRENVRLQLVKQYADTLRSGLELLNIPAPDYM